MLSLGSVLAGGFTEIVPGIDLQAVSLVNELRNAYSERSQVAVNHNSTNYAQGLFQAGTDIQWRVVWSEMQEWLETNCIYFLDHRVDPASTNALVWFSLQTWRECAALTNGFRRATEWTPDPIAPDWDVDPDFTNGIIQAGDILGPWIWEDLQDGFGALKWTGYTRSWSSVTPSNNVSVATNWSYRLSSDHYAFGAFGCTVSCASNRTACKTDYDAGWTTGSDGPFSQIANYPSFYTVWRHYRCQDSPGMYWVCPDWGVGRQRSAPTISGIAVPAGITYDWAVWLTAEGISIASEGNPPPPTNLVHATDLDATGYSLNLLSVHDSGADHAASSIYAALIGDYDTFPLDASPVWQTCPTCYETHWDGLKVPTLHWILKWKFTYE